MVEGAENIRFNTQKIPGKSKSSGSGKNFEKILRKRERESKESFGDKENVKKQDNDIKTKESFQDIAKLGEKKESPKKVDVSLFDIVQGKETEKPEVEIEEAITQIPEKVSDESLSALFKGYGSKEKLSDFQKEVASPIDQPKEKTANPEEKITTQKNEKTKPNQFNQEQSDLSSINPIAEKVDIPQTTQVNAPKQTTSIKSHLLEIVEKIIDKLYTLRVSGKTETIINIKHSGVFKGANIVITSFDHAKGEFNVAFENLSQMAKNLLDRQENQNSLKFALEQKGYTVHIITATTLNETFDLAKAMRGERDEERSSPGEEQQNDEDEQEG